LTEMEVTINSKEYEYIITSDQIIKEDNSYHKFGSDTLSNAVARACMWVLEQQKVSKL
jgi:hypothetical protein